MAAASEIARRLIDGVWQTGPEIQDYGGGGGGGSTPGAAIVRGPFNFAFDTPDLTNGFPFYTPTVGDLLLNAFVWATTAWNGTTPKWDIFSNDKGLIAFTGNSLDRLDLDVPLVWGHLHILTAVSFATSASIAMFDTADPLKIVVSQDGTIGGADPGASQGAAGVYLVTATASAT